MSIGPLGGLAGSAAGAPLAQTKGSEIERLQQAAAAQESHDRNTQRAENAAGVGEPDADDHEVEDRDADGRRPWEIPAYQEHAEQDDTPDLPPLHDPNGHAGNVLDLSG